VVGVLTTCAVMVSLYLRSHEPRLFVCLVLLVPFVGIALTLARLGDMRTAGLRLLAAGFGPLYLGVGFGAVASLRVEGEPDGAAFVLLALGLAWLSDTGGYFVGKALGRRKLYPAVSPKKTVEGAVGGVIAAVAGAIVIRLLVLRALPWLDTVVLAAVGSMMGQLGDLGESVLKRTVGVKDSGAVVPGHGGMLDRVDAALITAPIVLAYVLWRGP
jgi:phosphatidate cytidylyltransferase